EKESSACILCLVRTSGRRSVSVRTGSSVLVSRGSSVSGSHSRSWSSQRGLSYSRWKKRAGRSPRERKRGNSPSTKILPAGGPTKILPAGGGMGGADVIGFLLAFSSSRHCSDSRQ